MYPIAQIGAVLIYKGQPSEIMIIKMINNKKLKIISIKKEEKKASVLRKMMKIRNFNIQIMYH